MDIDTLLNGFSNWPLKSEVQKDLRRNRQIARKANSRRFEEIKELRAENEALRQVLATLLKRCLDRDLITEPEFEGALSRLEPKSASPNRRSPNWRSAE